MTTKPEALEIHVLGAGKGESIVLRCPGGQWGVVDCYSPSLQNPEQNPTLRFLRGRGVSELEFLCLTHPHDDHFRGMSQLLDAFPVRYFWRFSGLAGREVRRLADYFRLDAEKSADRALLESANDFMHTMVAVQRRWEAGSLRFKSITGCQQLYPVPLDASARFQIWSFAPSGDQVNAYEASLLRCFTEDGRFRSHLPTSEHNLISVGLLVEFGDTRVILGADIEGPSWEDICRDLPPARMCADAVKVSHHGSLNGYIDGLWETFSARKKPLAVIAPYCRFRLPRPEVVEHIRRHTERVLLTCPPMAGGGTPGVGSGPLKSRLALRGHFGVRLAPGSHPCGRCTLVFDDAGSCLRQELAPPALDFAAE